MSARNSIPVSREAIMVLATYDLVKVRLFGASLLILGWLTMALGVGVWFFLAGIWVLVRSKSAFAEAIVCTDAGILVRNPFFSATIPYAQYCTVRLSRPIAAPAWFAGFLVMETSGKKAHYLPLNFIKLSVDGPIGIDRAIHDSALRKGAEAPDGQPQLSAPQATPAPPSSPGVDLPGKGPTIARPTAAPIPKTLEGDRAILG